MLELADIFQAYGPAYEATYGERRPPSHHDALWDIAHCRTPLMGGEVFWCEHCQDYVYSYHSCGNRHCPKCGGDRADAWRDARLTRRHAAVRTAAGRWPLLADSREPLIAEVPHDTTSPTSHRDSPIPGSEHPSFSAHRPRLSLAQRSPHLCPTTRCLRSLFPG